MFAVWVVILGLPGLALAAGADPARIESTVPGGGMLVQLTLGLVVVLALSVGLSWLLRRYALPRGGAIRVVGGLPLGSRERLLLIEVDAVRLLIGITPHQIQTLHVFTSSPTPLAGATPFRLEPSPPPAESPHDTPNA